MARKSPEKIVSTTDKCKDNSGQCFEEKFNKLKLLKGAKLQEVIPTQEELEFLAKLTNPKITHMRVEAEEEFIRLYNKSSHRNFETWQKIVNTIGNVWGYNVAREIESKAKHSG